VCAVLYCTVLGCAGTVETVAQSALQRMSAGALDQHVHNVVQQLHGTISNLEEEAIDREAVISDLQQDLIRTRQDLVCVAHY